MNRDELSRLTTESRNPNSAGIDTLPTLEMLKVINNEDQKVALAVKDVLPQIAEAVDAITNALANDGRLIYTGAGTSGRLGILDASECPPTYGTSPDLVVGVIAGGRQAILNAVENAEDNVSMGKQDLMQIKLSNRDVVVGIAASGQTPYVLSGLDYANELDATTVSISCNAASAMADVADIAITPIVGPEVVTGSSRMKAGTAQKLVLNMLTTGAMIRSGKVFGNLMVNVEANNAKLVQRQINIVVEATGVSAGEASQALEQCGRQCKTAIFMILAGLDAEQAKSRLKEHNGFIRSALAAQQSL
ncbi:N-acetylmuramic acid-6-phosphate etherase [Vibrio nigripulchritudo ATCC 27043]|uniref:N-acetylmuramic acid 6-phosphate etherase n=1 Tax=Vibrio nigripulchritudo TaxID=28173 RepID=UPI00021C1FEC|nr:N-acetylmuramic acid 6-phosphate etherase [Vibrio nigripulchritudo]EGU53791.1 N-acetylmuramic acid-6-phosphate etherase [Vibrio nigripulchritudo ATCC 27043]